MQLKLLASFFLLQCALGKPIARNDILTDEEHLAEDDFKPISRQRMQKEKHALLPKLAQAEEWCGVSDPEFIILPTGSCSCSSSSSSFNRCSRSSSSSSDEFVNVEPIWYYFIEPASYRCALRKCQSLGGSLANTRQLELIAEDLLLETPNHPSNVQLWSGTRECLAVTLTFGRFFAEQVFPGCLASGSPLFPYVCYVQPNYHRRPNYCPTPPLVQVLPDQNGNIVIEETECSDSSDSSCSLDVITVITRTTVTPRVTTFVTTTTTTVTSCNTTRTTGSVTVLPTTTGSVTVLPTIPVCPPITMTVSPPIVCTTLQVCQAGSVSGSVVQGGVFQTNPSVAQQPQTVAFTSVINTSTPVQTVITSNGSVITTSTMSPVQMTVTGSSVVTHTNTGANTSNIILQANPQSTSNLGALLQSFSSTEAVETTTESMLDETLTDSLTETDSNAAVFKTGQANVRGALIIGMAILFGALLF